MLVSGMLISCTTNTESNEQQAADSTAQVMQGNVIHEEVEETEAEEAEVEVEEIQKDSIESEVSN